MEDAAEKKAKTELFEHNKRVEGLAATCETFRTAKARLDHENNKVREAEIWDRYLTTDRKPYPEDVPNMHDHLYLWQQDKSSEYMEFALSRCDSYVDTLMKLDELIEYPLYSTKETVSNWKELRREWREEFLKKLDKACFNMIKNVAKNFKQDDKQSHVYVFESDEEHIELGMCAYIENKSQQVPPPLIRSSPKINFSAVNAEIVMPSAYRTNPFILRLMHLDQDFFSETSYTYYCPEAIHMEPDLLSEIHRCFEAKKEAKSMVADREREKVRQAKLKVSEIQAAANQAEKSFQTFQNQQVSEAKMKKKDSKSSLVSDTQLDDKKETKKKKGKPDFATVQVSDVSIIGPGGAKRPRGVMEDVDGESMAKSIMQSTGTKRALDTISMRSGMRKKLDRLKKVDQSIPAIEAPGPKNLFYTPSMISLSRRTKRVVVHRASELCFEAEESEFKMDISDQNADDDSFDSLDLMFGTGDDPEFRKVPLIRQLIKETVIVDRDPSKRHTKTATSISIASKKGRTRGKSNVTLKNNMKGLIEEPEEFHQTASEVFETTEEARQEQYMSSLLFQTIPHKRVHINLREHSVIGGTYILDVIFHESQPHPLPNGNTVQIFYGEMNIKRDKYAYDYRPPPPPEPDQDPEEAVKDPGLQHLLHVKISLPADFVFLNPPFVGQWDEELKFWTREHIHNLEIDLESHLATFSLGRVRPFAFFLRKYSLLPFISWNMKPKLDTGGVILTLHCEMATFEFYIYEFKACLSKAVTSNGEAIHPLDIIGEFMQVHRLIDIMKSKGLNIFPDEDAFLYVGSNSKDVVLEDHTNFSMAMFSDSLEFVSSDLNMDTKRQKVTFKARECLAYNLELRWRTVVATTLSAQMYRLGIDDNSIDDTKLENFGFCPDVYSLLDKAFAHVTSVFPPNPLQILATYTLLSRVKVLSYTGPSQKDNSNLSSSTSKRSIRKKKKGKHKAAKSLKGRSSTQSLTQVASTNSQLTN